MLQIWSRKNSGNVMPVLWVAEELGLPFRRYNVGGSFGGLDSEQYLKMNPNGLVPTINDNGWVMWESNAILRYLAARYDHTVLYPEDLRQRALMDQWMEWMKTTFYPGFKPAFWQLIRVPMGEKNQQAVVQSEQTCAGNLLILDKHLSNHAYIAGENFSIGDIPFGPVLYRYFNLDIKRPVLPNVENWYARLCERPAFQKHGMMPFGKNNEQWVELEKAGAMP